MERGDTGRGAEEGREGERERRERKDRLKKENRGERDRRDIPSRGRWGRRPLWRLMTVGVPPSCMWGHGRRGASCQSCAPSGAGWRGRAPLAWLGTLPDSPHYPSPAPDTQQNSTLCDITSTWHTTEQYTVWHHQHLTHNRTVHYVTSPVPDTQQNSTLCDITSTWHTTEQYTMWHHQHLTHNRTVHYVTSPAPDTQQNSTLSDITSTWCTTEQYTMWHH